MPCPTSLDVGWCYGGGFRLSPSALGDPLKQCGAPNALWTLSSSRILLVVARAYRSGPGRFPGPSFLRQRRACWSQPAPSTRLKAEDRWFLGGWQHSTLCESGIAAERFAWLLRFKGDTAFLELGDACQSQLNSCSEDVWRQRPEVPGYLPEDCLALIARIQPVSPESRGLLTPHGSWGRPAKWCKSLGSAPA